MNLIAFSRSRNCVNAQYAALSGAMYIDLVKICQFVLKILSGNEMMRDRQNDGRNNGMIDDPNLI